MTERISVDQYVTAHIDRADEGLTISVTASGKIFPDKQPRGEGGFIPAKQCTADAWIDLWNELHRKILHRIVVESTLTN